MTTFNEQVANRVTNNGINDLLVKAAQNFVLESTLPKYSYNFSVLGRPIIQYPQDMVAIQELIWKIKPDLIIETGIAHGGSLILSASILALLDMCEAIDSNEIFDPKNILELNIK
jgi:cephalosporin hydroxylase